MGYIRKKSWERLSIPKIDQDTLLPCPKCKGNGSISVETATSYSHMICKWCIGTGGVTRDTMLAYLRIKRIYEHNIRKGKCK